MLRKYTISTLSLLAVTSLNIYCADDRDKTISMFVKDLRGKTYRIEVKPGLTTNTDFINLVAKAHTDLPDPDRICIIAEGKRLPTNKDLLGWEELTKITVLHCVVMRMSDTRLAWLDVTTRHNRAAHILTNGAYKPQSTAIATDIFKTKVSTASAKPSYSADLD